MNMNFSMNSFVVGIMVGAVLSAAWLFDSSTFFTSISSPTLSGTENSQPESGAVSVTDQPAGSEVVVESVTVPRPGVWVAVREVNGGDLGNVLGAARVQGPRTAVAVPLLRPTIPGLSYAVQLYRDDGDSIFDLATDSVYVDFATGVPVVARFAATN